MAGVTTDWQLGCVEVKQRGEYLLKSGQWSDCTFLVGAETDQVVIVGHKLVLAMASPVFEAMFYGGMAESNDPIPILDVHPEAFRALLEYIYTDKINISSFDIACELYYAAKKYMLPHLVKECSRYLWSNPKPSNACRAYELARLFEENVHMYKCMQIISTNTKEVLTDSSFEDAELNTVITIFSLDYLNVDNELDLFEAAVRYAKAQDKRTSEWSVTSPSENGLPNEKRSKSPGSSTSKDTKAIDSSEQPSPAPSAGGSNKPDPKSDKPTIRSAIEKIRFLTLTPQQFVDGPARFSLLTVSEACAVLMNITSSSSDVAMPSGFSTCRVHRERLTRMVPFYNKTDDFRRKHAELSVALRELARDEQLLKSKALSPEARENRLFGLISMNKSFSLTSSSSFFLIGMKSYTPAEIVQGLRSDDLVTKTTYARAARVMLSREHNPPISSMVTAGVIKPLVDALHRDDCADLQFEAAWVITNIVTGTHEHTMAVVDGGAIPKLVVLLARGGYVGEQSAWALGNIAGDGAQMRDAVLSHGALAALLPLCTRSTPVVQLRTAMWTYRNFCRHRNPPVKFEYVAPALPYVSDLLEITDQDVLADACWALYFLTKGPTEHIIIEAVQMTPQLLPRMFNLLVHESPEVRTPALRAIGNMLTGSHKQTDRCLDAGFLGHIVTFLRCGVTELMKDAAWSVSNILAGTHAQIQRAVDSGVLQQLVHVLAAEDNKCQKEAAWAIANLCRGGTPQQRDALISAGLLEPYCQLLSTPDHTVISVVLDGLTDLLKEAVKCGQVDALCRRLEQIGALGQIKALQQHGDEQICKQALHIWDNIISRSKKT